MLTFKNYILEVKKATGDLKDACWKGYTAVGMKMKNGKKVPNCVPESVEEQFELNFTALEEAVNSIDRGEYDYEGLMARTQLQTILRNSTDLIDMLSDDENLPEWIQSKITLSQDYISTVIDYLHSKKELNKK